MSNEMNTAAVKAYRALAVTDESTCGFCGKQDLQKTIAFEELETGEIIYAGTTCAQTVKLLILDESTGEVAPRTSRQILSILERATREAALLASIDLAGWKVAALIQDWNANREPCSRGYSLHTLQPFQPEGLEIPCPQGSESRQRAIWRLASVWARRFHKIASTSALARREALAGELHESIELIRLESARSFPAEW